jgi:hypothetical protein
MKEKIEQRLYAKYGKELLSKKEVQAELGISEATLDLMRKRNEIKSTRVGGQIKFLLANVASVMVGE